MSELEDLISQGKDEGGAPRAQGEEGESTGGEAVVVAYRTFAELEERIQTWCRNDFYPVLALPPIDGEYGVLLRAPRRFPKDEKAPAVHCQIHGGPFSGDVLSMTTAEALWGAGLISDPKSGRAKMLASAKKATRSDWEDVIRRVWPQVENPVAERGYKFLDEKQDGWFDDWGGEGV